METSGAGDEVVKFGNEGNKRIFDDVFGRLGELYKDGNEGRVITGTDAQKWDEYTLHREQFDIVDPIYLKQSRSTITILRVLSAMSPTVYETPFRDYRFSGDIMSAQDRYNHGMTKMVEYYKYIREQQADQYTGPRQLLRLR